MHYEFNFVSWNESRNIEVKVPIYPKNLTIFQYSTEIVYRKAYFKNVDANNYCCIHATLMQNLIAH